MHAAKLTFQALRIHLNDEFGELRRGMHAACELLGDNGRLGLLTWKHSECAIVVDVFRALEAVRPESPLVRWYREARALSTSGASLTKLLFPTSPTLPPPLRQRRLQIRTASSLLCKPWFAVLQEFA